MRKRRLIKILEQAHFDATMEQASFSRINTTDSLPKSENEVTAFIRERTRIWRQSWILSPLEEALKIIKEDGAPK